MSLKDYLYYQDDWATIYCGDCRDIIPHLEKISLIITDPPYASGARTDASRQVRGSMLRSLKDADWFTHDALTTWGFHWFLRSVFTTIYPIILPGSHIYVFTDWRQTPNLYGMLESCGYRVNHCLVWKKLHYGMGTYWRNQHEHIVFASLGMPKEMLRHDRGSVLDSIAVRPNDRQHPTEKPLGLIGTIIDAVPGELILDPFMGSGTILKSSKIHRRKSIGIEINPDYCEIAVKRLRQEVFDFR